MYIVFEGKNRSNHFFAYDYLVNYTSGFVNNCKHINKHLVC